MNFLSKHPLRITIPFFLIVAGIIISVYSMLYSLRVSDADVEKSGMIFVTQDMSQLQGNVNDYLREGIVERIKVVIADRGSDPNIELVLLADENNLVLHSTSLKLPGLPIQQAVPDINADLINHARKTMSGKAFLSRNRDSISAYFPVVIGARPHELRPSLVGILFMKYDLTSLKAAHRYAIEQQMWQSVSFYGLLFLCLGIFLYYVLTKRVLRLVAAAKRFAAGDASARSGLQGKDEIAQIGEAFDNMVQKILSDQEALRESEERFRLLAENARDMIYRMSLPDGRYEYVSPASTELFGYAPEEFYSSPLLIQKVIHPAWHDYFEEQWTKLLSGDMPPVYEYQIIDKSGGTRWLYQRNTLIRDAGGRPIAIQGIVTDITERKQVEQALQTSEAGLREAQHLAHIGNWDWDATTDAISWSDEYYRIYGFEIGSAPPDYIEHLKAYTPESAARLDAAVKKAMENGDPYELDLELASPSFMTRWICARGEAKRDPRGRIWGLRGTAQNITDRKKAEEEIRKLNEELEQRVIRRTTDLEKKSLELQNSQMALMNIVDDLNNKTEELEEANIKLKDLDRLKSMFIASMSHELRTPLNSIIGFSSILHDGWVGPVTAGQKENLATILRSGKHLLNLINDVIDVSKIESGKIEISYEDFDVYDVISEAVELFKKDVQDKGLDLKVEPIHLAMHSDRRRLLQCVVNLISNAVKFTEKGSVRISARIGSSSKGQVAGVKDEENAVKGQGEESIPLLLATCPLTLNGDFIEISVEDTGIGIREEDLTRLFGAFVRLHSPLSTSVKGTGLGLYLTKKIVTEILGGEISAEGVYGKGSRFVIRIPVKC